MQTNTINTIKYIEKLGKIEKDILMIKKNTFKQMPISMKGILKNIEISEKDIQKAKLSVFKKIKI